MKNLIYISIIMVFSMGCFAYVDKQQEVTRVKTFVITEDESLDLVDQINKVTPQEKKVYNIFND